MARRKPKGTASEPVRGDDHQSAQPVELTRTTNLRHGGLTSSEGEEGCFLQVADGPMIAFFSREALERVKRTVETLIDAQIEKDFRNRQLAKSMEAERPF